MVIKMVNAPVIVDIKKIINETPTIKTFFFDWDMDKYGIPNPGEFIMVWNFENEKPMSISIIDKDKKELGISVKDVGEFTHKLHQLNEGDKIGIRGSYGHGFNKDLNNKKILAIGGGVGMAPVNAIATELLANNEVDVIVAGINKDELLFKDSLKEKGANIYLCTDDGSCGFKGFATDCCLDVIKDKEFDFVVVCGPEIMMKGIYDILNEKDIDYEFSLERYMKCAIGICGQCCLDPTGWRICAEGPVFDKENLSKISEFGKYKRDVSGKKL